MMICGFDVKGMVKVIFLTHLKHLRHADNAVPHVYLFFSDQFPICYPLERPKPRCDVCVGVMFEQGNIHECKTVPSHEKKEKLGTKRFGDNTGPDLDDFVNIHSSKMISILFPANFSTWGGDGVNA